MCAHLCLFPSTSEGFSCFRLMSGTYIRIQVNDVVMIYGAGQMWMKGSILDIGSTSQPPPTCYENIRKIRRLTWSNLFHFESGSWSCHKEHPFILIECSNAALMSFSCWRSSLWSLGLKAPSPKMHRDKILSDILKLETSKAC